MASRRGLAADRTRTFLAELANLGEREADLRRFRRLFGSWWPEPGYARAGGRIVEMTQAEYINEQLIRRHKLDPSEWELRMPLDFRNDLRRLWSQSDQRTRWHALLQLLHRLYEYEALFHKRTDAPLPPSRLEEALRYFFDHASVARTCANRECPAPYFFASRKSQRYCSEVCAVPAQREQKRKWWAKKGKAWRRERRSAPKPRKRQ